MVEFRRDGAEVPSPLQPCSLAADLPCVCGAPLPLAGLVSLVGERRKRFAGHKTAFLFVSKSLPSPPGLYRVLGTRCGFLSVLPSVRAPDKLSGAVGTGTCGRAAEWFSFIPPRSFNCLLYFLSYILFTVFPFCHCF